MLSHLQKISFILASGSPRRIEFLDSLQLKFEIIKSNFAEKPPSNETPSRYAMENAYLKAMAVAEINKSKLVAGFDTIVEFNGKILGKPENKRDAFSMLTLLSGKKHNVITSYSLINLEKNFSVKKFVTTEVFFNSLENDDIEWYIETGEPFDKAGAYAIQGIGSFMIKEIKGSFSNVVGLPLAEFIEDLGKYYELLN